MLTNKDIDLYWQYCLYIENDLYVTTRFVEVNKENYKTYSAEFAKIIMLACSEIDVICRLLCKEIERSTNFDDLKGNRGKIDLYAEIILRRFPNLTRCTLNITKNLAIIRPFEEWSRKARTSPKWWKEYQKIKHYRHSCFDCATQINALSSVAGLIVLNLYLSKLVVGNINYSEKPKMFDAEYFSQIFMTKGKAEVPDF